MNMETISVFSFPEKIGEIESTLTTMVSTATKHVTFLLDSSVKKGRENFFKEFFLPYSEAFKIINAYTSKINQGLVLLEHGLSTQQKQNDMNYWNIKEQFSRLENKLVPKLKKKQTMKKIKHLSIFVLVVLMHIVLYTWLFRVFN
ncbi:MAG: hypothetical protein QM610_12625 [Chitinophagaceae bacterium]